MLKELLTFLKAGFDPNVGKLVEVVKQYGINEFEARVISSAFLGWVESYLNGATCPKCLSLMTPDAREIFPQINPAWDMVCPVCGEVIKPILITPYRLTLTIMNHASIFDTVPDNVKLSLPEKVTEGLKKHWERVSKIMERVKPDDLYVPILSWMREERPDLYFTILFFNTPSEDNPIGVTMSHLCSTIYKIDFYSHMPKDHFLYKSMMDDARKSKDFLVNYWFREAFPDKDPTEACLILFGKEVPTLRDIRDTIIEVLNMIAKQDLEELERLDIGSEESESIVNGLRISTEGIKWYATEIEEIYIKGSQMLAELIKE